MNTDYCIREPAPEDPPLPAGVLHWCGRDIEVLGEYPETLSVYVSGSRSDDIVVTLGSTDGDGGLPNIWWNLDPASAEDLARQLLHHANVARDYLSDGTAGP